jgi:hypothetical protein
MNKSIIEEAIQYLSKDGYVIEEDYVKNAEKDWKKVAKEPITLEQIGGAIYAYGSELATLRLLRYYMHSIHKGKAMQDYSTNMKTFYFRLEI